MVEVVISVVVFGGGGVDSVLVTGQVVTVVNVIVEVWVTGTVITLELEVIVLYVTGQVVVV